MTTMATGKPAVQARTISLTRILLLCGAIAGPLFIFVVLIQDYSRPGFDPRIHMLSQLSLGDGGWVQVTNFVLAGVLNLLYAVGLWRRLHPGRGGTWGPIFIAAYGLGLVAVGIFRTDPSHGYPPGLPTPTQPSWHNIIHSLGGLYVFVMLAIALAVFTRFFLSRKEYWWGCYCLLSAVLLLIVFFGGFTSAALMPGALRLGTLIGWMGASMIAIKLLTSLDPVTHFQENQGDRVASVSI
ncbi:DUF998 domain-containing protein [Dictyobacter aurantiacus]|uniref:DUF998 domain-containing protein n=1 Tax=Dictyobacter aurantiacus TaxID=1936993 RepID=A0A401ZK67_9CHLR|nr:DUF998 domain-containing protein [Dictyobacter aurantiacus]GCE07239.1 hypothetical protein KDAU_45680 [Dictyobacter aurantiacus]